jgi:N-acetylglucosaminyldiphosphoundecaprenol N-acetyl-beta-D-mannosaminyltransferase
MGIQIVGTYSPPHGVWSDEENTKIIESINKSHADVLWFGVSTPKQDKWIYSVKTNN